MNKVNYIKTGQDSSYYGSNKPKGTDVESWIRQEMEKTDRALSNFEDIVTKAEDMTESVKISDNSLNETEYTPNARKCIDAANLLGQIDLKDIEDAAKIKDQVERLFDKLVKLAPKLNKKEQKEIEEASKCDEDDIYYEIAEFLHIDKDEADFSDTLYSMKNRLDELKLEPERYLELLKQYQADGKNVNDVLDDYEFGDID